MTHREREKVRERCALLVGPPMQSLKWYLHHAITIGVGTRATAAAPPPPLPAAAAAAAAARVSKIRETDSQRRAGPRRGSPLRTSEQVATLDPS